MESRITNDLIPGDLGTDVIGRRIFYFDRLTSTMDTARREADRGAPEGTTIIAGSQTAGRGRLGRTWLSPEGGIAVSIILYPDIALLPSLIMLASLAVMRSIAGVTGLKAGIKWPNDVLINGRKVCGILTENRSKGDRPGSAIIGIGLNINLEPDKFPEITGTATSLSRECGRPVSRPDLIRRLLREADGLYSAMKSGESVFPEWRDNLLTLGQAVRASYGNEVYEGTAESVTEDGSLWLRQANGELVKVVAGDVTLQR
jgi:BirA family biotin operon repressor/biotin-[acetyl-CoA-carboxylase] ligase